MVHGKPTWVKLEAQLGTQVQTLMPAKSCASVANAENCLYEECTVRKLCAQLNIVSLSFLESTGHGTQIGRSLPKRVEVDGQSVIFPTYHYVTSYNSGSSSKKYT